MYDAVSEAVARARAGVGPGLVETKTYRFNGHAGGPEVLTIGPPTTYRSQTEVAEWRANRDPILLFHERLFEDGVVTRKSSTSSKMRSSRDRGRLEVCPGQPVPRARRGVRPPLHQSHPRR